LRKVVIVDDEFWAIESLKDSIDWNALGYEIAEVFTSAEKALLYLKENPIDVAIVDLMMPGIDGITLIDELRSTNNDIIFIIVSGLMDFENARRAVRLGVDEFFVKPVNNQVLTDTLVRIKKKLDLRQYANLPDIQDFLNHITDAEVSDEKILNTEYLGLNKKYSYCFGVMFEERHRTDDITRYIEAFSVSGMIMHFSIFGKYLFVLALTDVFIDYQKAIESINKKFADETVGISAVHNSVMQISDLVEESSIAFFNRFLTEKKHPTVYTESNKVLIDAMMKNLNTAVKANDMQRLNEFIGMVASNNMKVNIDEVLLFGNTILFALNYCSGSVNFDYLPPLERLENRFPNFIKLINYLHSCVNNLIVQRTGMKGKKSGKELMQMIKIYVDEHCCEYISLSGVAEEFGVGEKYLGKVFKKYTGENFTMYINKKRIERAKNMLIQTQISVKDISEMCGYGDYPYFARVFKQITGVSATELRNKKSK